MSQRLSCETCSLNLSTLHHSNAVLFLCRRGGRLQKKSEKERFQEFCFLQLPANLSDILSGGRFVLDTVTPEMTSRELLPIIVVVFIIHFIIKSSSFCYSFFILLSFIHHRQPEDDRAANTDGGPHPKPHSGRVVPGGVNFLILDHWLVAD